MELWERKISGVWIIYIIKIGGGIRDRLGVLHWTVGEGDARVVIRSKGGFRSPMWDVLRGVNVVEVVDKIC